MSLTKVAHGDTVTATHWNNLKAAIDAAYTTLGTTAINPAGEVSAEKIGYEDSAISMFHRFRWLAYTSTGIIRDPSGVGADVTISDGDVPGANFYDLESIEWLTYGMYYTVIGIRACQEFDLRP